MTEHHRLAVESYRKGELSQAERLIGSALTQGENSEVWNDWAMVQLALGRQIEAEQGFRKALQFDRHYRKAASNLGILLFGSEKFNESVPFLQQAHPASTSAEREMLSAMLAKCDSMGLGRATEATAVNGSAANGVSPANAKLAAPPVSDAERELQKAYREFDSMLGGLRAAAEGLAARFPEAIEARFFLADVLLASGRADEAILQYEKIKANATPNQVRRAEQGIQQSKTDRDYFPPDFAKRLVSDEYASGINAEAWRNYANREIQRGRLIARHVRQHIPLSGRRMLDVGCGYGGTLVCFAEQGCDVVGVEIDPERARVGKKRLADIGIQADYRLEDICAPGVAESLGAFDVIVVQDVLEHVMDPALTIRTLSSLLRKDGVIYVVVGNKYSPDQLLADHHYAQAGMTILARPQAMEYYQLATGYPAEYYAVGYWRTEFYYRRMFARHGVQLDHIGNFGNIHHILWYAKSFLEVCRRAQREIHPGLNPVLQARIQRRMLTVARYFSQMNEIIAKCESNPELKAKLCDRLVKKLCLSAWSFVGVKKSTV
jgi:2-polyprenyl-3-methyl-5-hydroxy-6-metoxy-1,4-benzoquinol methylase/Tfp pilus assembly protein PilF